MERRYRAAALRILLALLFLFSGIAKALNPYGFSVKAMEYLTAMGLDSLSFMQPVLGIGIPALEMFLGLLLLFRIMPREVSAAVVCLMSVFTVLTLWDLVASPVGDCGCFGDIVKLTPLESFLKNIVILGLSFRYLKVRDVPSATSGALRLSRIVAFAACSLVFPGLVYKHLPLYDVSGYVPGTVIYESSGGIESAGAKPMNLLYRNRFSGDVCSFALDDTEWQDSTVWEFVGIQEDNGPREIQEKQFPMLRDDFTDVSSDVLSSSDSMLIVIIQDPDTVPDMSRTGIRTIALSAYDLSSVDVEHYGCDFSLLKQMMPNSMGGAFLVHEGVILGKWAMRDCPYLKH